MTVSTEMPKNICIVGGGPAGLVLARALKYQKYSNTKITLMERYPTPTTRGSQIALNPDVLNMLTQIDPEIVDKLKNLSTIVKSRELYQNGKRLGHLDLPEHMTNYRLMRVDIASILTEGIEDCIRYGCKVLDVKEIGNEVEIEFEQSPSPLNNTEKFENSNPSEKTVMKQKFDFVVACDGSHSQVAKSVFGINGEGQTTFAGFADYHATCPAVNKGPLGDANKPMLIAVQSDDHVGLRVVCCTAGRPNDEHTYVHISVRSDKPYSNAWDSKANGAEMKQLLDRIEGLPKHCYDIVDRASEEDGKVFAWGMWYRKPYKSWISPNARITIMGDAAHPMTPYLGRGANEAIVDAFTLAKELGKLESNGSQNSDLLEKEVIGHGSNAKITQISSWHILDSEKHVTLKSVLNSFQAQRKDVTEEVVESATLIGKQMTCHGLAGKFMTMFNLPKKCSKRMMANNGLKAGTFHWTARRFVGKIIGGIWDMGFMACEVLNDYCGYELEKVVKDE